MKTIEKRGASSAGPISDVIKSLPPEAILIAGAGSRYLDNFNFEIVYALNGEIFHLSLDQKGGLS